MSDAIDVAHTRNIPDEKSLVRNQLLQVFFKILT